MVHSATTEGAYLQSTDGTETFPLSTDQCYRIGRGSQVELQVRGSSASRLHAILVYDGRRWVLQDMSSQGTLVNGRPVLNRQPLQPGDVLRFGEVSEWLFLMDSSDQYSDGEGMNRESWNASLLRPLLVGYPAIIGSSEAAQELREQCSRAACATGSVIITGACGTGRRLVARYLHARGTNASSEIRVVRAKTLSAVSVRQMMSTIKESRIGTVVLDELLELSTDAQQALLDGLREIAGTGPRWISITSSDAHSAVNNGQFLGDLFLKLGVIQIVSPALSERVEDIPELAAHFGRLASEEFRRPLREFSGAALDLLTQYHWPLNMAELKNVIDRTIMHAKSPVIERSDLVSGFGESLREGFPYAGFSLEQVEAVHINSTLLHQNWVKSHVAKTLGIERSTLDRKIVRYNIVRPRMMPDYELDSANR
jgi:transcriptional regulator with PAS, ATPase and Fis domain